MRSKVALGCRRRMRLLFWLFEIIDLYECYVLKDLSVQFALFADPGLGYKSRRVQLLVG